MGQWPIRNYANRCHPDNKKARSGAFIYQQSGSGGNGPNSGTIPKEQSSPTTALARDYTVLAASGATPKTDAAAISTNTPRLRHVRSLYPAARSICQTLRIAHSGKHPAKNNAENSENNSQNDNRRDRRDDPLDHEYDHGHEWHLNINDRDLILTVVFH
jgi:hypothetical protein